MKLSPIINATCSVLDVQASDVRGTGRNERVVLAREIITLLARDAGAGYQTIAAAIRSGRRMHTTCMAAYRRAERRCKDERGVEFLGQPHGAEFRLLVRAVCGRLNGSEGRAE